MPSGKEYELAIKIAGKVDKSFDSAVSGAGGKLQGLGNALKNAGKIAATAAAAAATAAAGLAAKSLETYGNFEQAMANTAAIAGATEEQYAALETAAREMGAKTTKSATEAAEALGYMALAGWNTEKSIAGLEPVLRLSEATQMDLARCSDLVTDSMSAMGLGVDKLSEYLDLCVQTNNKANTTSEALMEAFIGCGGAAKTAGINSDTLATALGILANNGTKGAEAGTALNSMLTRMTTNDAALTAFEQLGVAVFDSGGKFRGLETVLNDVSAAMDGMSDAQKMAYMKSIAGTNYFTEMSYLLDSFKEFQDESGKVHTAWGDLSGELSGKDGALMNMAGKITSTFAASKAILQSAWEETQITLGKAIAPYAQEGLLYLANNVLPMLTNGLKAALPGIIQFGKFAVNLGKAAFGDAFRELQGLASTVLPQLLNVIKPLMMIGANLIRVVLPPALQLVKMLLPPLLTLIQSVMPVLASLTTTLEPLIQALMGALSPIIGLITQLIPPIAGIIAQLGPVIEYIGGMLTLLLNQLTPVLTVVADVVGGVLSTALEGISPIIGNVMNIFNNLLDFFKNVFSGNWAGIWENVKNIFVNIFSAIANYLKIPINTIISVINNMIGRINGLGITIPDWVPVLGGKSFSLNIPEIPMLAAGGIAAAPTMAMVGEGAEPEAILPLSKLANMLDGKMGQVTNSSEAISFAPVFNFYGPVDEEQAVAAGRMSFEEFKRLYDEMKREEARKRL